MNDNDKKNSNANKNNNILPIADPIITRTSSIRLQIKFGIPSSPREFGGGGTVGSDVTLRQNWAVFIRGRTMAVGAALAR